MKLKELIVSINDKTLPREALEAYSDQLSVLFAQMMLEKSEIEKKEALWMATAEGTVAMRKVYWKATTEGQRLIELKNYLFATKEMINSLKSRVFRLIY